MRLEADQRSDSPESVVRKFLAAWADPKADELANFFADDAVWVDGPQGVRRGANAIVDELIKQLVIARGCRLDRHSPSPAKGSGTDPIRRYLAPETDRSPRRVTTQREQRRSTRRRRRHARR